MNSEAIEVLDRKYTIRILLFLLEKGETTVSSLTCIVSNYHVLRDTLDDMERVGLVSLTKEYTPRRRFGISLTPLGREVAGMLLDIGERMSKPGK
ncbi:MAG: hypothetical protein J7L61_01365 [Thermoplasmata archaeon]|nr:hypothetical protein [Thermoplasmata archaeon]